MFSFLQMPHEFTVDHQDTFQEEESMADTLMSPAQRRKRPVATATSVDQESTSETHKKGIHRAMTLPAPVSSLPSMPLEITHVHDEDD